MLTGNDPTMATIFHRRERTTSSPARRLSYHAMGLELQLGELTVQRGAAEAQGRADEVRWISEEIAELQEDLARTAELISSAMPDPDPLPVLRHQRQLSGRR
jgi:hypothetical protein